MGFLFFLFIFIFGAAIGSFLNVLAERLPRQESIRGRSHCDHCRAVLGWPDLIPIFSFLFLRGRCRKCKKPISIQYPIVELTTGLLFIFIFWPLSNLSLSLPFIRGGLGWGEFSIFQFSNIIIPGIYLLFITSCLIVIFIADLKYFIIPDEIIIAGSVGAFLYRIFYIFFEFNAPYPPLKIRGGTPSLILREGWGELYPYLLAALGASSFFLLIVLATKGRGMGLGDVKLAFLMGLLLGWPLILPALFLAFTLGAIIGVILILSHKAKMKSAIPFGPFLIAGTFLALFFGDKLLAGYWQVLFGFS